MDDKENIPIVDYAIVSSVDTDTLSEEALRTFGSRLAAELNETVAERGGSTLHLASAPTTVQLASKDNEASVRQCYSNIRQEFPSTLVVFHILPGPNSLEYRWMCRLAGEMGLARQGVLGENALDFFGKLDSPVRDVCANMLHWLDYRVGQLAHARNTTQRPVSLVVRRGSDGETAAEVVPTTLAGGRQKAVQPVGALVSALLHGAAAPPATTAPPKEEFPLDETDWANVSVVGFPDDFSPYEVAGLFARYTVRGVRLGFCGGTATVRLRSRFEALQASEQLDGTRPFEGHQAPPLSVRPRHPQLERHFRAKPSLRAK